MILNKHFSTYRTKIYIIFFLFFIALTANAQHKVSDTTKVSRSLLSSVAGLVDWGMDLITIEKANSTYFVLPTVGYEDRTGFSFGVMPSWRFYLGKKNNDGYYRPSNVTMFTQFSTTGMFQVYISSELYSPRNWYLKNKNQIQIVPDRFYHIGNDTNKDKYSEIDVKKFEFDGRLMKGVSKTWFVGMNYDIGAFDIENKSGSIYNSDVVGIGSSWFMSVGPSFTYDSRNNVVYTEKGTFVEGSFLTSVVGVGDFKFSSLMLDARKFFSVGPNEKVIGLQLYSNSVFGNVPFYRLASIGGKSKFRGIGRPYRYLDNNSAYLQMVFRSKLIWKVGYEIFSGVGNVFNKKQNNFAKNMHVMGGLGLRIRVLDDEKLSLRFDYGITNRGDRGIYFTLGEAF